MNDKLLSYLNKQFAKSPVFPIPLALKKKKKISQVDWTKMYLILLKKQTE